jgi:hypothetical protein
VPQARIVARATWVRSSALAGPVADTMKQTIPPNKTA